MKRVGSECHKYSNTRTNILLTVRTDLLGVRKALLDKHVNKALHGVDWLIDFLDECIVEGESTDVVQS